MTEKEKLVLKSSFMDKTAVLDILKTKFGHSRFRSDEQKKAIFTLIGGLLLTTNNQIHFYIKILLYFREA